MKKFVFENFDDYIAKVGKYWYYIDQEYGVLFKSKYNFKRITYTYGFFYFTKGEKVYIINKYGETLICTDIESFNSCIAKENRRKEQEFEIRKKAKTNKKFKGTKYDTVNQIYCKKYEYYIVTKDNLYALVDSDDNTILGFKYKHLSELFFPIKDKLCFIAIDSKTDKQGIININGEVVIPFIYDLICNWNTDKTSNTIAVIKEGKCGVINYLNNETIIDFKYKYIFNYGEDDKYSLVENFKGFWGLMDKQGNILDIDLSAVKEIDGRNLKKKPKINVNTYIPDYLVTLIPKVEKSHKQPKKRKVKPQIINENQLKLNL